MKALIIEDDAVLLHQLANQLSEQDYQVDTATNGEDGLYQAKEFYYDIAVVDIGLPKLSGIEIVEALRNANSKLPILILTARSSWKDKVSALRSGADDYLVKPFQPEELLARLEALLRRAGGYASSLVTQGPISLDLHSGDVQVNGTPLKLTALELKVLQHFLLNPDKVISKIALADYIYDAQTERDSNVIEVIIARLRQKLDPDNHYKPIETLRGRGYKLRGGSA